MYRLVVYELTFLLLAAGVLGFFHLLPYNPIYLGFSVVFIFCISWIVNKIFASMFDAPSNPESTWITALILVLIITPPSSWFDAQYLPLAFWASSWAIATKYMFAIQKKHIFNPAAAGVAITSLILGLSASWWIGTLSMVPFVLFGGLLLIRKIHRFDLWWAFIGTFVLGIVFFSLDRGLNLGRTLSQSLIYAPAFFFATVMLTEPLTTPPTRFLRILYGGFVGFLFLPYVSVGSFYFTPELALIAGNVFSYLISPKYKLILKLKKAVRLSPDVYEFVFGTEQGVSYKPGQYMEWTLAHPHTDSRSVRRYFTLSSSPTEQEIKMGVKFYEPASSFKKALLNMNTGESLVASQLAGDFTLPRNKNKKLVFIAGGIGITPFRSMVQYLIDREEKRNITLLYSNKTPADAVYADLFSQAEQEIGLKTIYAFSDKGIQLPQGAVSRIDAQLIMQKIPDYMDRIFYISGPQGMVTSFKDILLYMGVKRSHIKTDYFPGFA